MRVIAVDWSGEARNDGASRTRWYEVCDAIPSTIRPPIGRTAVIDRLIDGATSDPSLVVGLDFAFSMPAWYLREQGLAAAPDLWRWLTEGDRAESLLLACGPPFWGRGRNRNPRHGRPELRATDTFVVERGGGAWRVTAKSVFQVGGAGAVGTGSLRGMTLLSRLRDAGFAIWPFDPPRLPLALEIYPRAFTGPVRKSRPGERAAHLAPFRARYGDAIVDAATSSGDDFDAFISALAMWDARADLVNLPVVQDETTALEGLIWRPGWRDDIAQKWD